MAKYYLTLVICVLLPACGSDSPSVSRERIEHDLGLSSGYTETEAADRARELVHQLIPYEWADASGQLGTVFSINDDTYHQFISGQVTAICGEQSAVFIWLMHKLGIPARHVWLHGEQGERNFYHQTSEVFTDGKWWLSDPTFSVYYSCNSVRADAVEIRSCDNPVPTEAGTLPNPTIGSTQELWGMTYTEYFLGIAYTFGNNGPNYRYP